MNEKEILVPVQPYLSLDADDYKEIIPRMRSITPIYANLIADTKYTRGEESEL